MEWDETKGVCKVKLNGNIFYMTPSCIVNKCTDNIIDDFRIVSVSLSENME